MLFCSILRFLFNTVSNNKVPRGGNLTFSRCLGVGNLTLASMKMSNSPGSAHRACFIMQKLTKTIKGLTLLLNCLGESLTAGDRYKLK